MIPNGSGKDRGTKLCMIKMYIQFWDLQELELTLMHQNDMSFIGIWALNPDFLMLALQVYKEVAFILWFPFPDCLHFPSFFPLASTERMCLECLRSHCTCLLMIQSPSQSQQILFSLVSSALFPVALSQRQTSWGFDLFFIHVLMDTCSFVSI